MTRARFRPWTLGVVVVLLLASKPVFAISPSYVMFYGRALGGPVVIQVDHTMATGFLWETRARREGTMARETIAKRLEGRQYVQFAIFWGQWTDKVLKPEDASQHGRLYLATATEPAVVVVSFPAMQAEDPNLKAPPALPIPSDLQPHDVAGHSVGFVAGWILSAEDLAAAKRLGVPFM